MSVSSETSKIIYTGDGSTVTFPYTFKIFADGDLTVTLVSLIDSSETLQTITTHYTVSGAGSESGGNVVFVTAPSGDYKVVIERILDITQEVDYEEGDDFPAESHEEALDRLTFICQQLQSQLDRAPLLLSTATSGLTFPAPAAGFLYCDGSALSWASVLTTTAYPGNISAGDDADKSVYPGVKDIYFALDTGTIYYCATAGTWTEFTPTLGAFSFTIDGGGSAIAAGIKGDIYIPFGCTLTGWNILADQSGAIKIDVWRQVYASYPPTNTESLCNGHEPEIAASGVKAQDTDISDWTSVVCEPGDCIRFNVDSCTAITRATITLTFVR